jgi:hypothetical protein
MEHLDDDDVCSLYGKWRLESVQSGRTSLNLVSLTRHTMLPGSDGGRNSERSQRVPHRSKVKEVIRELDNGSSGKYFGVNKTPSKADRGATGYKLRLAPRVEANSGIRLRSTPSSPELNTESESDLGLDETE